MVSKRVSSSGWTGPTDQMLRRGAFTHRAGEFGGTTDYAWLNRKQPISFAVPEELRGVVKLAAWLLPSPVVLAAGWFAGNLGVRDKVISDASGILLLWGLPVFAFAFWQLVSRPFQLIFVRSFILALLMVATAGIAFAYAVTARRSYAEAVVSQPQRVFRYVAGSRKNMLGRRSAVVTSRWMEPTSRAPANGPKCNMATV